MKLRKLAFSTSALLLVAAAGFTAASLQDGAMPMPQPTPEHEWVRSHLGVWDAELEMMGMTSKATWTVAKGPGEFWNIGTYEGDMMGMPFTGTEIMGYDPGAKEFVQIWVDSMTPTPAILRGTYDKASKKLTMKGESVGMDGAMAETTNVVEYPDADHMVFTMGDGEMVIRYSRRK